MLANQGPLSSRAMLTSGARSGSSGDRTETSQIVQCPEDACRAEVYRAVAVGQPAIHRMRRPQHRRVCVRNCVAGDFCDRPSSIGFIPSPELRREVPGTLEYAMRLARTGSRNNVRALLRLARRKRSVSTARWLVSQVPLPTPPGYNLGPKRPVRFPARHTGRRTIAPAMARTAADPKRTAVTSGG